MSIFMLTVSFLITTARIVSAEAANPSVSDTNSSGDYTIIVTATRREALLKNTPGISYVIDKEKIQETNAQTVSDLFRFIPGLDLAAGTGVGTPSKQTVSMNGTPSFHNIVLVDGKRLLSAHFHTGTDLNLVPAANIARIEVVKDASSALYGSDALGGVINVITKKGTAAPEIVVGGGFGSEDRASLNVSSTGTIGGKTSHSIYTGYETTNGIPIATANSRSGQLGYKRVVVMNSFDHNLHNRGNLGFALHYVGDNDMKMRGVGNYDSWLFTPSLHMSYDITKKLSVSALAYYTQWRADASNEKNAVSSPSLFMTYSAIPKNVITGGVEYAWESFARDGVNPSEQSLSSVFIQDEFIAFNELRILGAARVDYVDNSENSSKNVGPVVSPKLSALYRPNNFIGVRAGIGRGFRAPSIQDLKESRYHPAGGGIWRYGNANLKPEYSTNINTGVELTFHKDLTIAANGYMYFLADMIALVSGCRDTTYQTRDVPVIERMNIRNFTIKSAELLVSYRMKILSVEAGGSATLQEDRDHNGADFLANPGSNAYIKTVGNIELSEYTTVKPYVGLNSTFGRKSPSGRELADYQNLSAGITITLANKYDIYINAVNILEQEMEVYEDALYTIDGKLRIDGGFRIQIK